MTRCGLSLPHKFIRALFGSIKLIRTERDWNFFGWEFLFFHFFSREMFMILEWVCDFAVISLLLGVEMKKFWKVLKGVLDWNWRRGYRWSHRHGIVWFLLMWLRFERFCEWKLWGREVLNTVEAFRSWKNWSMRSSWISFSLNLGGLAVGGRTKSSAILLKLSVLPSSNFTFFTVISKVFSQSQARQELIHQIFTFITSSFNSPRRFPAHSFPTTINFNSTQTSNPPKDQLSCLFRV